MVTVGVYQVCGVEVSCEEDGLVVYTCDYALLSGV